MPSASSGNSTSFSSKLSWVGMPWGRLLRCQARAITVPPPRTAHRRGAVDKEDPAVKGKHRRVSIEPPRAEAQLATGLAVGALKAAIQHPGTRLALVVAFEQRAAATFVAPVHARLV